MQTRTIFVGRQPELDKLGSGLDSAAAGHGALILVAGEPGMGKTRLVQEFAAQASRRGARVLWGTCHQERGMPPFWPWVEAIRAYIRDQTAQQLRADMGMAAPDIAHMVPEVRQKLPDLPSAQPLHDPDAARFRSFDAVTQFFRAAAATQPIVLVLEDIHWADRSSLLLLEFLAHELASARILALCTYRDTELLPLGPLAQALGEISRQGVFARILLQGLSPAGVRAYIEAASGHTPPAAVVWAVYAHTEGNPLYVAETIRHLAEEGRLQPPHWNAGSTGKIGIPEGVRQVIGKRLSHLSGECIALLATAAAMGRQFALQELQTLAHPLDPAQLARALDQALAARIIEDLPERPGGYQFSHALIRETLYDGLGSIRRMQLHRRIGEVLEALYSKDPKPPLDELAHHFCAAGPMGDATRAMSYAVQAAVQATAVLAYDESAHYYRMALEALERKQPRDEVQRRRLLLALGDSYRRAGATPEALRTYEQAAQFARQEGAAEDLALAALGFEDTTWRPGLSGEVAARLLGAALKAVDPDARVLRAKLSASLARALVYAGDADRGLALGRQAVQMARRTGDPETLAAALRAGLSIRWKPETIQERLDSAREMAAVAQQAGDRDLELEARSWLLFDLLELGDTATLDAEFHTHAHLVRELRQPFYLYIHASLMAARATWEGRFLEAEELAQEALVAGQRLRGLDAHGVFGIQMFTVQRAQGRLRELEAVVRSFVQRYSAASTWGPGLALIYSELGLEKEARVEFERLAADEFSALPRDAVWLASVVYLAEVCAFLGDRARAATLYQFLLPFAGHNVVVGPTAACLGSASYYLGLLATTMRNRRQAEEHFQVALAMNERIRARPWLALTKHAYAEMLLVRAGAGDQDRARILFLEALSMTRTLEMHALAERIQARLASRPLAAAPGPAEHLTPREVEVLRLVASGRTNREIAETLLVSVNTVANHVKNILGKTQTLNRTELTVYALRHNLVGSAGE